VAGLVVPGQGQPDDTRGDPLLPLALQVLFRYVLNASLAWSEELAKGLMVWSVFLIAPFGYRNGVHVAITLFSDALPRPVHLGVRILINLLVGWISTVLLIESLGLWQRGLTIPSATLPVNMAAFYSAVVVSLAALLLVCVEILLRHVHTLRTGRDHVLPGEPS